MSQKDGPVEMVIDISEPSEMEIKSNDKENSAPDTCLILHEKFDFDLPVSPLKSADTANNQANKDDQEEEVFFGPVSFTEKCIASGVEADAIKPLSPLRADQWAQLAKEAFQVAYHIGNLKTHDHSASESDDLLSKLSPRRSQLGLKIQASCKHSSSSVSKADNTTINLSCVNDILLTSGSRKRGTEDSGVEKITGSPGKQRKRCGTFTLEKDEITVELPETVTAAETKRVHSGTVTKSLDNKSVAKVERSRPAAITAPEKASAGAVSKLKPPASRLLRYNSHPNLAQAEDVKMREKKLHRSNDIVRVEEDKLMEGTNECSKIESKICSRPNFSNSLIAKAESRVSSSDKSDGGIFSDCVRPMMESAVRPPGKPTVRRSQSLNYKYKSGLPPRHDSKLSVPLNSSLQSSESRIAEKKADVELSTISRRTSGIPTNKGIATKLQLLHPGQLQRRSSVIGRGKVTTATTQSGPMKATVLPAPILANTVERPFNPALAAAAGNIQCPATPSGLKRAQAIGSSLSSEGSTPARHCSSSSVFNSTPGSANKRISMLPTPSKRLSMTGSLPPPSPLSLKSTSSIASVASVSSSDAGDSPVFCYKPGSRLLRTHQSSGMKESCSSNDVDLPAASPFAFKPRKALVQYTPDLPKKASSQWSPVRRPKPPLLEDQVSMCTKRIPKQ